MGDILGWNKSCTIDVYKWIMMIDPPTENKYKYKKRKRPADNPADGQAEIILTLRGFEPVACSRMRWAKL